MILVTQYSLQKKKKKSKHIDSFFLSKDKKYKFYYKKKNKKQKETYKQNCNFTLFKNTCYGLVALETKFLETASIKALLRAIKWYPRKYKFPLKTKLNFFPDFVLTNKPNEIRMGKGKGQNYRKVAYIKKNQLLVEFMSTNFQSPYFKKLLLNCKLKLKIKTKIIKKL